MVIARPTAGFNVSDAGLLWLKLSAFVLMVADHVDWFLYGGALGVNATLGRAVFPVFATVLGLNLARMSDAALPRVLRRLVLACLVASAPYVYLQGAVLPLNVLATFALATAVVMFLRRGQFELALPAFVLGGVAVDYAWFGVAAVVAVWWLTQAGYGRGRMLAAALLVVPFNDSWWSLLVLVLGWAVPFLDGPRRG